MTPFLDQILSSVSNSLYIQKLSVVTYLILVFTALFGFTAYLSALTSPRRNRKARLSFNLLIYFIVLINTVLLLVGVSTSIGLFHYSLPALLSILMIPLTFYALASIETDWNKHKGLKLSTLVLAVLIVFLFGSRHLINGVHEEETTSDIINILINGHFRWSVHGSHYDLAPLDAILKVMLSYTTGDTIFSPVLASVMYTCYGLSAFMLVYVLTKTVTGGSNYALTITLLTMLSYPYSPIIGLSTPPVPQAHLLAVAALTFIVGSLLGYRTLTSRDYFVVIPLILAAILTHPSTLGLVLYLVLITLWLAYRKSLTKHSYVLSILIFSLIIYFAKVMYTAFAAGFVNYIQVLWDYAVNAFREREITAITTRNPSYSELPRLCLTGFATLLGYLAGLALPILVKTLKRKQLSMVEQLFIVTLVFYGVFVLVSISSGLGGISQSRIATTGAQPYMELALTLYLAMLVPRQNKALILIPLAISVLATLITPNAIPLNYTIPMAAKAATFNDHVIGYKFTELIDKFYFAQLYSTCGDIAKIVVSQERGDVSYVLNLATSITYYFIAPGTVHAKSYWDSCIMAIYAEPKDVTGYVVNRVFDAWVYGFYIYARR